MFLIIIVTLSLDAIFPGKHESHDALPYIFVDVPGKHGKHVGYDAFSDKYVPGWHG